ncbi:hypothetical protein ABZ746_12625 [Streptomyces sp. NPDC020096]
MNGEDGSIGVTAPIQPAPVGAQTSTPRARSLVVLAVEDGTPDFTKAVDEQIEMVTTWWNAQLDEDGPGFVQSVTRAVTERAEVEMFLHNSGLREAEPDGVLVLYITGHGAIGSSAYHFLLLPATDRRRLLATAVRTNEVVIAALDSYAGHVLVIVNACEAEGITSELNSLVRELDARRLKPGVLTVLATTGFRTPVLGREFAVVLRAAHTWLRDAAGITRKHLTLSEFLTAIEHAVGQLNAGRSTQLQGPRPVLPATTLTVPLPTLPNPGYRPPAPVVASAREEVAATQEELDLWLDRASGRPHADDPGWYFSGRQDINRALVAFLEGPPGVLVVTGTTATGKSAVLGRAVTLSDPDFRSSPRYAQAVADAPAGTVPAEGAVNVAVSARNRGPVELLATIATKLGLTIGPAQAAVHELRRWRQSLEHFLYSPGPQITIVVDAIDEALDPVGCVRDVLAPLAGRTGSAPDTEAAPGPDAVRTGCPEAAAPTRRGVRLLVGLRSSRPSQEANRAEGVRPEQLLQQVLDVIDDAQVVRTDGDGIDEDIAAYVSALISDAWAADPTAVQAAARTVAARVTPSFLDARLAAEQLRQDDAAALLADPQWLAHLDRGTVGLLEADVDQVVATEGLQRQEIGALLRATAFAQGAGMPWAQVWPAVAEAVLGARIDEPDKKIGLLLGSRLAGYLSHDSEDDRVVYRPAHQRLAVVLRRWSYPASGGGGGT